MKRRRGAGNPISTGQKKILGGRHALVHDSGVLTPDSSVIKDSLCAVSRQLGFSGCRVARAEKSPHAEKLFQWLERGWHAGMEWMARSPERRTDPAEVLLGCRSVICLSYDYDSPGRRRSSDLRRGREAFAFTPMERITTEFWRKNWRICRSCFPFTAGSRRGMWTPAPLWNGTMRRPAAWAGAGKAV